MLTIVIIAFNRLDSLKRLLSSISLAEYAQKANLIISIDKGNDNQDVLEYSNKFIWNNGEKIVIYQSENLGLRKHVLKCGDLTYKYGNIIMLEDDLFVAPGFYNFAQSAIKYYENNDKIAGISLYSHKRNVHNNKIFYNLRDESDIFFMQFPSSWGQSWTCKQWDSFKKWYKNNCNELKNKKNIPDNVLNWPESSWLKYFISYMIETNKFFVYPNESFSTNYGDKGTHFSMDTGIYQVPLTSRKDVNYKFKDINDSISIYDAFFENMKIIDLYNNKINKKQVLIDFYGQKYNKIKTKYLLTSKRLDYEILKSYDGSLIPYELNIINQISGNDIFLYNISKDVSNKKIFTINSKIKSLNKIVNYASTKDLIQTLKYNYLIKIKRKIRRKISD
ncbi:hypothetical protein UT300005_14930 [Clostridium sp. CTA-5]